MDAVLKVLAVELVDKIYRKVRSEARKNFFSLSRNVGIGADGSPTSYVDKVAEDVAVRFLKRKKARVNLLSEEVGLIDVGGEYTFVLDPVDGTRNAYRGIPFYAVSLAVGRCCVGDVEFGVVKNIPTGDVFRAERGQGAFFNNQRICVCEVPSQELLSSIMLGRRGDSSAEVLSKKEFVRSFGSASLEMCMVAAGGLDFYYVGREFMRVVDIAAATLIVREAGGFVKTVSGEDLDMGFNLDERTSVVAACSNELIQELLSGRKH